MASRKEYQTETVYILPHEYNPLLANSKITIIDNGEMKLYANPM